MVGLRLPPRESGQRTGWQHRVERKSEEAHVWSRSRFVAVSEWAGGRSFIVLNPLFTVDTDRAHSVQGVRRRLALPLPLSNRTCRCGHPLDAFGHHRAACARCGVLGRRGFTAGRVCREAGVRVVTDQFVRDWILECPMPTITGGLRLLSTGCHCLAGSVPGAADRDGVVLRSPSAQGSHSP